MTLLEKVIIILEENGYEEFMEEYPPIWDENKKVVKVEMDFPVRLNGKDYQESKRNRLLLDINHRYQKYLDTIIDLGEETTFAGRRLTKYIILRLEDIPDMEEKAFRLFVKLK